jgi:hypothetical protein
VNARRTFVAAAVVCLAATLAVPAPGQASPPEGWLAVEVAGPGRAAFVGEVVTFEVRVVVDAAWLAAHGVPLVRRELDQPFHVGVPAWTAAGPSNDDVPPIVWREPGAARPTQRLAVGDRVVRARVASRAGEAPTVLVLQASWMAPRAGEFVLPPVRVRAATATAFVDSLLGGRQPVEVVEHEVQSEPMRLEVRPLPTPPRGAVFHGAVGRFEVSSEVTPTTVPVGDTVALRLHVQGDGNLLHMDPPPWPVVPGAHVQGMLEDHDMLDGVVGRPDGQRRSFVFELLAVREGHLTIPALPLVFFDPDTASYATATAAPQALHVAPRPAGSPVDARVAELIAADREALASAAARPFWHWLVLAAVLVALAAVGLFGWSRRLRRRAALLLVARVQQGGAPAELFAAFEQALRVVAGASDAASALDALRQRDAAAAAALARVHEALGAARYGGPRPSVDDAVAALRRFL